MNDEQILNEEDYLWLAPNGTKYRTLREALNSRKSKVIYASQGEYTEEVTLLGDYTIEDLNDNESILTDVKQYGLGINLNGFTLTVLNKQFDFGLAWNEFNNYSSKYATKRIRNGKIKRKYFRFFKWKFY